MKLVGKRRDRGFRSSEFPTTGRVFDRYEISKIPLDLWNAFRRKCQRQRMSVRTRILTLIKRDIEAPDEVPEQKVTV